MLNIYNLSVAFQGEYLFENVSFMLKTGDRVGLIGKNGAGKSTLLKIISGEVESDSGTISTEKGIKIGFLKQDLEFSVGRTLLEETYTAFSEIMRLEKEIAQIGEELAQREDYESPSYNDLISQLHDKTHSFDILGGHLYKGETEKILLGLGFKPSDFQKLTEAFSGGWRMRIELAKLLLQKNEVLLLDEPTNHLDIDSIIWLENFLKNYNGAIILVSHDRLFLDSVTNRTIEISLGKIYDYPKSYTPYMLYRQELLEQQLLAQKNQEKEIEHTEKLIEKFRAKATKASMAQSLIKKLEKVERIEVDLQDHAVMNVAFPVSKTPGKVVVEINGACKSYGDKKILKDIHLLIERGSKIAFVGQNGQGKTTLAKMIVSEIDYEGEIKLGHHVDLGYFAQNQAQYLDGEQTLLDMMLESANDTNREKVRDILGAFLFQKDDVLKKIKVLSGGERNRLALAKMLLSPFNLLVLDEPTNHLDIQSKNVLKKALQNFEGSLIIISHDRDFLQNLTEKVYEFSEMGIKEYLGDIDFFLEEKSAKNFREVEKSLDTSKTETKENASKNNTYELQKKQKTLLNKIQKVENLIADLEKEIKALETQMYEQQELVNEEFLNQYNQKKEALQENMLLWEELSSQIL